MCWVRPLERLEEPPLGPHKFFPREDSANLSMSDLSLYIYLYVYIYIYIYISIYIYIYIHVI